MGDGRGEKGMTGVYNYYPNPGAPPILCQVENDWVYSLHFEYTYHVSKFEGVFVELVEVPPTRDDLRALAYELIDASADTTYNRIAVYTASLHERIAKLEARVAELTPTPREPINYLTPRVLVSGGQEVAQAASGIAMASLQRTLDEGGTISIPSLGIEIGPPQDEATP